MMASAKGLLMGQELPIQTHLGITKLYFHNVPGFTLHENMVLLRGPGLVTYNLS